MSPHLINDGILCTFIVFNIQINPLKCILRHGDVTLMAKRCSIFNGALGLVAIESIPNSCIANVPSGVNQAFYSLVLFSLVPSQASWSFGQQVIVIK